MQHHTHNGHAPSHGVKVGIGTLAVTALYERMLEQPFDQLDIDPHFVAGFLHTALENVRDSELLRNRL